MGNVIAKYSDSVNMSGLLKFVECYVYWTVHHLDSGIKIDQLDVTCFIISLFTAQHVSNVSMCGILMQAEAQLQSA